MFLLPGKSLLKIIQSAPVVLLVVVGPAQVVIQGAAPSPCPLVGRSFRIVESALVPGRFFREGVGGNGEHVGCIHGKKSCFFMPSCDLPGLLKPYPRLVGLTRRVE